MKDVFEGNGKYTDQSDGRCSEERSYVYEGTFKDGKPTRTNWYDVVYPNQFRVSYASCPAGTLKE